MDGNIVDSDKMLFKIDLQKKYFDDMREHMRQNGVKIPIAGTNWTHGAPGSLMPRQSWNFWRAWAAPPTADSSRS